MRRRATLVRVPPELRVLRVFKALRVRKVLRVFKAPRDRRGTKVLLVRKDPLERPARQVLPAPQGCLALRGPLAFLGRPVLLARWVLRDLPGRG